MYGSSRDPRLLDRRRLDRRSVDGRTVFGGRRKRAAREIPSQFPKQYARYGQDTGAPAGSVQAVVGERKLLGLRGNVVVVEYPVPGGIQRSAYWPDAQGAYPSATQGLEGPLWTYPGPPGHPRTPALQQGDWELDRAGISKPAGFEDVGYFVRPPSVAFGEIVVQEMFGSW
jgi:hypothetical protein